MRGYRRKDASGDKMDSKSIVLMVAVMMVATVAIGAAGSLQADTADSQDAATFNVSFKGNGAEGFQSKEVNAYDGYQAVEAAAQSLGYTVETSSGNDAWYVTYYPGTVYEYREPNPNYGVLESITENSTQNSISSYHIYAYCVKTSVVNEVTITSSGWYDALDALGWMHPYEDYSAYFQDDGDKYSLAVSNIAICYGEATDAQLSALTIKDLVTIDRNDSAYRYSFNVSGTNMEPFADLTVTTWDDDDEDYVDYVIPAGTSIQATVIYGWGSNAFEALKDALGSSNVIGQEEYAIQNENSDGSTYYTFYSWMDTILGSGTESSFTETTSTYRYWASYTDPSYSQSSYCSYTFGYYSGLSGAPNACNDFGLRYEEATYTIA